MSNQEMTHSAIFESQEAMLIQALEKIKLCESLHDAKVIAFSATYGLTPIQRME